MTASTNGERPTTGAATGSPVPERSDRWQPLRLGLLNVYRFDDEEFGFSRGRLLLRGNNGTGKSRVLALTLPLLLDGELAPHRLEPDQDQAKRPEWNLLLGRHEDRLGYTWIEFGRWDGEQPRYLTLGCGMRAVKGRGIAQRWYFTTDQRVSVDLSLVGDAGQALVKPRLEQAIGDRGHVHDTAKAYRADVDRRLFGLGERRYEALVELLIALRRPQLSRQLDETALSDALSEALPPLPQSVVDDVAEAFRTLEADRNELDAFIAAAEATRGFLGAYRRYAAVALRRRVKEVTATNSAYETTQRGVRAAETTRDQADEALERIEAQRRAARDEEDRRSEEVRTLETSPAMDRARELEHAQQDAASKAGLADETEAERASADEYRAEMVERREAAAEAAETTRSEVVSALDDAASAAGEAHLADAHARSLDGMDLPDIRDPQVRRRTRERLDEEVSRRAEGLAHLTELSEEVRRADGRVRDARMRLDEQTSALDAARDEEREAAAAEQGALTDAVARYGRWAAEVVEAEPPDPEDVGWQLEAWSGVGEGRSPLAIAVDDALTAGRQRLADDRAAHARRLEDVETERAEVATERERVAGATHLPPPALHTRDRLSRQGRPGAPLWQVVELVDGVDPEVAAGYEAALEAAGLLDAWVTPDGRLLDADDHDVAVLPPAAPAADGGLRRVLRPAVDRDDRRAAALTDDVVARVLAGIGAGADTGEVWVSPDGRYRIGPLHGTWSKPTAEHLGHAAREEARRRRLAELDMALGAIDERLAALAVAGEQLEVRSGRLAGEVETAPTDTALREAGAARTSAAGRVARLREAVASREAEIAALRTELERAVRTRSEAASDLGLRDGLERLEELTAALATYREAIARLWPTLDGHAARLDDLDRIVSDVEAAERAHDRLGERAEGLRSAAIAAVARRDTLEATVGVEVAEITERLAAAKHALTAARGRLEDLAGERDEARDTLVTARTRIEDLAERLEEEGARREAAIGRLVAAVRGGFVAVAGIDPDADDLAPEAAEEWSADRAVRTARRLDRQLHDVAVHDEAWTRIQNEIHNHFSDLERALLTHDLRPTLSVEDELIVVTTTFKGDVRTMPGLRDILADEVESRQALLSAREREIIENHLIGEVAAHLHRLLHDGEQWVVGVNDELERMPTSTGMQLRFAWRPRSDGPAGLGEARRLLLSHHAGWSPQQREEVGAFLQERIAEVREADDAGTWQQHLAEALDYRRWHTFVVERRQDGEWRALTRRTHGTGSGGEKALALTVPQFAAAAAHYRSAAEHAPRLIMLDEAFVGIDADMRAKCMGLLEQFDLDLVMTSEREWGCYPSVPGIAIAQLATRPGIDAVGVSRWVWNGRERLPQDSAAPLATSPAP